MTKIAYLECPTGIAGDMCLGSLVDAGVPLSYLTEALGQLGISSEYRLSAAKVHRNGQQATKVYVDLAGGVKTDNGSSSSDGSHGSESSHSDSGAAALTDATMANSLKAEDAQHHTHKHAHSHSHHHPPGDNEESEKEDKNLHHHSTTRHLPEIEQMIKGANLPHQVTVWSLAIFRQLAEAEGAVHGISPETVHFHEVGATDAIVDIVGTCLGLNWLGINRIYCSPLPTGGGTTWAAHGRLPIPAPAVLRLFEMRQVPLYSNGIERELVTPTGAAIATTLATRFGPPPAMTLLRVGLGAGSIDLPLPNILRLWIGEGKPSGKLSAIGRWDIDKALEASNRAFPVQPSIPPGAFGPVHDPQTNVAPPPLSPSPETIAVLETQIDDLNPQAIGYLYEVLFAAGALDVFTQAIGMKKSRPGTLLTVVCRPEDVATCESTIFLETTTLGIRQSIQQRQILQREIQEVETQYGMVRVKVAWANGDRKPINIQPEYEDCAQIARQQNLPWREVHRIALQAWYGRG